MSNELSVFSKEFITKSKHEWIFDDPDIFFDARTVKNFYRGYPYVHRLDHIDYFQSKRLAVHDLMTWLDINCTDKYRLDYLSIEPENEEFPELDRIIQPMYGVEYMFLAFKEEKDYSWFKMRWL